MTNTIKNTAAPMKERLKGFGQIAIAGIILALLVGVAFAVVNTRGDGNNAKPVKEPNIKVASADNTTNDDNCIKENLLVYEDGKWTEKEIIYPWSNCFDLKNSEKFDGFAYENAEKPNVEELKKEAKEKVFSILIDVGLPGENKNKTDKLHSPLDRFISVVNKQKVADEIVNKMDEKELFRFVFITIVVEDVERQIKKLDSLVKLAINEDKGLIFVYLNDKKYKEKVKEILKPHVNKGVNIVFLKGKYTTSDLKGWKKKINKNISANINTTAAGFSVFLNKIIIYAPEVNDETLKKISNYLKETNISLEGVYIEERDIRELSRSDKIRPLIGGIQIYKGSYDRCTLGIVAKRNGVKGFITAGHCAPATSINLYQLICCSDYIGRATITTCTQGSPVYADVAWIPTSQSISPEIYKDSKPNYIVAGKIYEDQAGYYVCKSGSTTYETCGTVSDKCPCPLFLSSCRDNEGWDQEVDEAYAVIGMSNNGGDSGSPVFTKLFTYYGYTYVGINGVLFAGNKPGYSSTAYYSSIGNVEMYTGSLEVTNL